MCPLLPARPEGTDAAGSSAGTGQGDGALVSLGWRVINQWERRERVLHGEWRSPELHHRTRSSRLVARKGIQQMEGRGSVSQEPRGCGAQCDTTPCPDLSGSPRQQSQLPRHTALAWHRGQPVLRQQPLHQHELLLQLLSSAVQPRHGSGTFP